MNKFKHHASWHHTLNVIATAFAFIGVGVLFLCRNLEIIDPYYFKLIVSWQSLLIYIGVIHLIKKHFIGGAILVFIGSYFLFPQISALGAGWLTVWWPVLFILLGILILFKRKRGHHSRWHRKIDKEMKRQYSCKDGHIYSDVSFGSSEQIIFDPVFKGGDIKCSFGHTVVDFRRSTLEEPETIIHIDASFSGIELYVPSTWDLAMEINHTFSGYEDKRFLSPGESVDANHKVIIRGELSFSGLEIK